MMSLTVDGIEPCFAEATKVTTNNGIVYRGQKFVKNVLNKPFPLHACSNAGSHVLYIIIMEQLLQRLHHYLTVCICLL